MIIKTYRMDPSTMSGDPIMAANGGEQLGDSVVAEKPQPAVDAARHFVKSYDGPDCPRATVTRRVQGYRNPKNAPRVIFRCWRMMDGTYKEERVSKEK
jgi:hypothetical protein